MKRRFNRTSSPRRQSNLEPVRAVLVPALGTAGDRDAEHFPFADTVTLTIGRADLDTIAAALVFVGHAETLSLLRRFRCI